MLHSGLYLFIFIEYLTTSFLAALFSVWDFCEAGSNESTERIH